MFYNFSGKMNYWYTTIDAPLHAEIEIKGKKKKDQESESIWVIISHENAITKDKSCPTSSYKIQEFRRANSPVK